MAGAEQTTYPRMTTIVCLTDLIFALDMPSNEWALGLKKTGKVIYSSTWLVTYYINNITPFVR